VLEFRGKAANSGKGADKKRKGHDCLLSINYQGWRFTSFHGPFMNSRLAVKRRLEPAPMTTISMNDVK
jgi:hypothetical protein